MKKLGALLVLTALSLTACALLSEDGRLTVRASFTDVGDLATSAPVMLADIPIGQVTDIELEENQAMVTMEIDPQANVPQGVVARVRRTSLLGEKFVDFLVPEGIPLDAPPLKNGDQIVDTEARADLEDLVAEGTDVLAPLLASEIATLVDEGAKGFGGRGEQLGAILNNFQQIVQAYAGRTDEIRGVITNLNQLNATLASKAPAHAKATVNSAKGLRMLVEESERLKAAIVALNRLSVGARGVLEAHSDEMSRFFRQARTILDTLNSESGSIERFLKWAPFHNRNTAITDYNQFVQVLQDFIICGLNDDPNDPARQCIEPPS
jgi:phospholipid/cholesterol/gamma-HCH transport system substrate-binding protein